VVKSLSPRRSASLTMSFRLASRARRNRSSAAATSSSSVSVVLNVFDVLMSMRSYVGLSIQRKLPPKPTRKSRSSYRWRLKRDVASLTDETPYIQLQKTARAVVSLANKIKNGTCRP
jgi:hypothetical protein